jgi:molybdate transport system substrate-binding protein
MLLSFGIAAQTALTVFAAASLHLAFPALAQAFERAHPGVSVRFSFNGSQILETQLEEGAPADVFASADKRWMDKAVSAGVVSSPVVFAGNSLVLIASPRSNIRGPRDLARRGVKVVLCAQAVPCGAYSRRVLAAMDREKAYGPGYSKAVAANVVSEELNVEAVLSKVELGEADAGIVYRTDAAGHRDVVLIDLPPLSGAPIAYYIGVVRNSAQARVAASFVRFALSPPGRAILATYGFASPR